VNQSTPIPSAPKPQGPARLAELIGVYVRALVVVLFWLIAGTVALAVAFLAVRLIWFALQTFSKALGI
jgi:hypothetical protein